MQKKVLAKLYLLLTPDVAQRAVFTNYQIIGFKNGGSHKDPLIRAVLRKLNAADRCKPCGLKKHSCEVCNQ